MSDYLGQTVSSDTPVIMTMSNGWVCIAKGKLAVYNLQYVFINNNVILLNAHI